FDLRAATMRDLREKVREGPAPPRIFAYPTDAWVYLALPADNPTPFALLRPVYNTPEQFQTAIDRLEQDPRALVFLNRFSMKPDDPFLIYLRSRWPVVTGVGPPVFMGTTLYKLYAREPTGGAGRTSVVAVVVALPAAAGQRRPGRLLRSGVEARLAKQERPLDEAVGDDARAQQCHAQHAHQRPGPRGPGTRSHEYLDGDHHEGRVEKVDRIRQDA